MKTLSILLLVVLLLGVAVEVASAAGTPYVVLAGNKACYIYWDGGAAAGTWRLRWNYYNGKYNLTYDCNAYLSYGRAPSRTLHFADRSQPWCTIQNLGVISTNGRANWTCQGKYSG
jgi:hypothetical protein